MSDKFQVIVADPPWAFFDKLKMSDVARGAAANYNTMTISDIKAMKVKEIADPTGAILALWVPSSLLQEGLDTMNAWGFKHKQTYIWVKTKTDVFKKVKTLISKDMKALIKVFGLVNDVSTEKTRVKDFLSGTIHYVNSFDFNKDSLAFGMGRLFRQTHEICLIGTNNTGIYKSLKNKSQRSVSFGENLKHSAKPEHLQDSLEIMFPGTKMIELFARRSRAGWTCLGNEVCNGEDIRDSLKKL